MSRRSVELVSLETRGEPALVAPVLVDPAAVEPLPEEFVGVAMDGIS
jgi:hypothetical protein